VTNKDYQCDLSYIFYHLDQSYMPLNCYQDTLNNTLQQMISDNIDMIEVKFISKVTTMGPDRLFVQIPRESLKAAKDLKGKYVKVSLKEITLEE
jgi:hypothetical protein